MDVIQGRPGRAVAAQCRERSGGYKRLAPNVAPSARRGTFRALRGADCSAEAFQECNLSMSCSAARQFRRSFVLCRLLREVLKRRAFAAGDSVPNVVGPVARADVLQAWGIGMGALRRAVPLLHVV